MPIHFWIKFLPFQNLGEFNPRYTDASQVQLVPQVPVGANENRKSFAVQLDLGGDAKSNPAGSSKSFYG